MASSVNTGLMETDFTAVSSSRLKYALPALVEIHGLSKAFGSRSVLAGIDLKIFPGEFVSILGPSGGGKTTLLRMIAGLEQPTSGSIRFWSGHSMAGTDIRVMFQEDRLLPWRRVIDNVALGLPKSSRDSAEKMLERVGLRDHACDWPMILSGGQRQRVALARALVHQPALLLLDEPFGSLDALTRSEMQLLLESLWVKSKTAVLLVTHDIEEALRLSDRVYVLRDGKVNYVAEVSLPRPRHRGHPVIIETRDKLEEVIKII
jgi:sulfonate transport system ATP-binding protein